MKSHRFSIPIYVTIAFLIVFTLISAVNWGVTTFVWKDAAEYLEIPRISYTLLASVILGMIATVFLSKQVLDPVIRLDKAMKAVAEGDYSVRLPEKSIIREIRNSCKSFNIMAAQIAATEVLQSDFVTNVSHEIKTPVGAIEGYAMLLQEDPQNGEYVEKILLNTRRLSGLVGNVLLLSRLENQSVPPKAEQFRLDEQIRYAIVSLEPKWEGKEIEFDVDMESVQFYGSEPLLLHVWLNLIDNAIKFDPYGGLVRIRLKRETGQIFFTIQDNGPGVKETQAIFGKFYQSDSSHKDEGNGLGLALVKRIVQLHGGGVSVANHAGGGAEFTVTLPLREEK